MFHFAGRDRIVEHGRAKWPRRASETAISTNARPWPEPSALVIAGRSDVGAERRVTLRRVARRDIYELFRALDGDERFAGLGIALRRETVDGSLSYIIVVSGFEFDSGTRDDLHGFADDNSLRVLAETPGEAVLTTS